MRLKHIKKVLSEEEIENFERYRDKISCKLLRWANEEPAFNNDENKKLEKDG
jgi:hypothetical protein